MNEQDASPIDSRPWEEISRLLESSDLETAQAVFGNLSHDDQRIALSRLPKERQIELLELLELDSAAHLIEVVPDVQAVDLLSEVNPVTAAGIAVSLPDQATAELIREMDDEHAEEVLSKIDDRTQAERIREISSFPSETAGGLMTENFAVFPESATVSDVLFELNSNASHYGDMDVQYVYVAGNEGKLRGVLRLRDVVMTPPDRPVRKIMIKDPVSVKVTDELEELSALFSERSFVGLPVVTDQNKLKGVISAQSVREAAAHHQIDEYRTAAGILGGEELRSMNLWLRCRRRLAWLCPNIVLNLISASVIALYQDTLESVIALAVFLPIVSDMSGCSGNQAVAVSMRELTLGLIRPTEYLRIVWKEGLLGIINGVILGVLLGGVAGLWQSSFWLGVVIGGALALNTILSVLLGGCVPLLLKRLKIDPALASGPILTTCTDMCGFFLVLNLASLVISQLAG